ncbi:acetyltransferase (putative) [Pediococcus damnosus]|uniref:Acetyltransferase (Putative) n=1 Tax=Pediococcus damnosus TaxID=51663 RepID=A0A0R2HGQ4_9LACO|nr:GNAT family N-acetyltransferase [Pediococcus damnosus]AMV60097.1 acetyltransferase (putative) [Pediococcus damnosus]AMV62637.1 acetyltransferase (putative) [Pediococcus damnosus]AMV64341.1 acetyltransferase (putative) [Pediococcus damnosus]AMV67481.1 acetyltransferase (putative) [Pediococcus damnosus]AMV69164.1 acetyltransferase (putative) [Pediococcus damnosus]
MKFTNDGKQIKFMHEDKLGGDVTYFSIRDDQTLVIEQVFVDPSLRGQGIAQQLMVEMLTYAKNQNKKIYPLCPYAQVYLTKHPEYQFLIDPQIPVDDQTKNSLQEMEQNNNGTK